MFKFVIASLFIISTAHAGDLRVECKMIDIPYMNQFSVTTVIADDADTFENLELGFMLKNTGRDSETRLMMVNRTGSITKFPGGQSTRDPFFIINSTDINDDLVFINLVVNYPGNFTSRLRFKDDMTYFGTCKTI